MSHKAAPLWTRLLAVAPQEAPRVVPAAAFQLSFVAGVGVLKVVASALVVARFETQTLPWLYLGAALAASLAAAADAALRREPAPPRTSLLISAAVTVALGLGAAFSSKWAVAGLYVFAEAYATVSSVRFWASMGEAFDPRESKRLFGVIGGFGMAGMILGGLLGSLGAVVGALPALSFSLLSMGACAALSEVLRRRAAPRPVARSVSVLEMPAAAAPARRSFFCVEDLAQAVRKDRYLRLLAVFAALAAMLTVMSDFLFRVSAQGADEDELAAIFGGSNLVLGVCAMGFQLFAAGRVLSRFGVFRYLGMVPVGTVGVGLACAAWPSLGSAFALKVVESLGSLSLQPTGMQLLYAPLADDIRVPARAWVDGLVKKGGAVLGGLALLALSPYLGRSALALAVVCASVLVVGVLLALRRAYVAQIDARLTSVRWGEAMALDAESRAILLQRLADRDPARVLMAADLLAAHRASPAEPWVRMLLAHPGERVRTRGVKLAAELGLRTLVPKLRSIAGADVRRPRDEAVFALARLDPDVEEFLVPFVGAADPGLRGAAIAALLPAEHARGGPPGTAARALERMLAARADASPAERRELARLLGRLAGTPWTAALASLLDDPDPSVRRLAAISAGECGRLDLAGRLLDMLADRGLRRDARQALASMGDAISGLVEEALGDRSRPERVRSELPRLLRYVGTARAAQILLAASPGDDPVLSSRVAVALSRLRRSHDDLVFDRARVLAAVGWRIEAYLRGLPVFLDLRRGLGERAILVRALGDRLDRGMEIVFRLLGLVFAQRSVMNVHNRFVSGDARSRAYALELFEHLVDEGTRARLLPVLERWHRLPIEEGEAERVPARLMELAASPDPVLQACALHTARVERREAAVSMEGRVVPEEGAVSENVVEKVFLLEGVSIFEKSTVDDLTALAAIAHERRFPAGTSIYRENDPGDALYVIVEGKVATEKEGKPLITLGAKEAFGELSLLDGHPRPAAARALEATRALVLDRQDFLDLLADRPELLQGLFAVLTRQMRQVLEIAAAHGEGSASQATQAVGTKRAG
ncbi:MAG: cyclic nucleotide-binding domain-containing protein [Deltaproteobacteria bacterium]|nr:cyclic nucleotide-binding domain-containing protein [Deltaproteobacteria bacterium]